MREKARSPARFLRPPFWKLGDDRLNGDIRFKREIGRSERFCERHDWRRPVLPAKRMMESVVNSIEGATYLMGREWKSVCRGSSVVRSGAIAVNLVGGKPGLSHEGRGVFGMRPDVQTLAGRVMQKGQ